MKLHPFAGFAVMFVLVIACGTPESKRHDGSFDPATSCVADGSCGAQDAALLAQQVFKIVKTNCAQCHNAADAQGGVALDTFEDLKRFGQSIVDVGLQRQSHPNVETLPLDETDMLTLETWEKEGFIIPDGVTEPEIDSNPGGNAPPTSNTTQGTGGGKFKSCLCKFLKYWKKSKYEKYCSSGEDPAGDPVKDPAGDPVKDPAGDPVKDANK